MVVVIFLRHGEAEEAGHGVPGEDEKRRLTVRGRKQTKVVAAALNHLKVRPGVLLTSPLVRARQTVEVAAKQFKGAAEVVVTDTLAPRHQWADVRRAIKQHDHGTSLVCGHQPEMGQYLCQAVTGRAGDMDISKSAAICVEFDDLASAGRIFLVLEAGEAKRIR